MATLVSFGVVRVQLALVTEALVALGECAFPVLLSSLRLSRYRPRIAEPTDRHGFLAQSTFRAPTSPSPRLEPGRLGRSRRNSIAVHKEKADEKRVEGQR
jgi:hypothetical protein